MPFQYALVRRAMKVWVGGALGISLLALIFSLITLLSKLNQPYGGFFWSWDNTRGYYRVDNLSFLSTNNLQPADLILQVNNFDVDNNINNTDTRYYAENLYRSSPEVCDQTLTHQPQVNYKIQRRGVELEVHAPIECFRWENLLRATAIPIALTLIFWWIGLTVYRSNPEVEFNQVFTLWSVWITGIMAAQVMITPRIDTFSGQLIAITYGTLPYVFLPTTLFHLIAIFPQEYPFHQLIKIRLFWYFLLPLFLIVVGGIRFQLGVNWHPWVRNLDTMAEWGRGVFLYSATVILILRYVYIFKVTTSKRVKHQVRIIGLSALGIIGGIPFVFAQQELELLSWIPINNIVLLLGTFPVAISTAYMVFRYQVSKMRSKQMALLIALALAFALALLYSPMQALGMEFEFLTLLIMLVGVNLFWILPENRFQRVLRRLTSPGSIEKEALIGFNSGVQEIYDLDILPAILTRTLENMLELQFVALWLVDDYGILVLEDYTDNAPAETLPPFLTLENSLEKRPTFISSGLLVKCHFILGLPLTAGNKLVGYLALSHRWTEEIFDYTDLDALEIIAHQAALTLNTAKQVKELRLLSLAVEEAQYTERERIAQNLHDSTLARLTQLLYQLENLRTTMQNDLDRARSLLDRLLGNVQEIAVDLRVILQHLIPARAEKLSIQEVLQEDIKQLAKEYPLIEISLNFEQMDNISPFSIESESIILVCRQALSNALIHANAQNISVILQLDKTQGLIEFAIIDNGRGFKPRPIRELVLDGHYGLHIMKSRIQQQGGQLNIESTTGNGTIVKGFVPVKKSRFSNSYYG